jgi:PKD repeat protein
MKKTLNKAVFTFLSFVLIASVSAQSNSQIWTKVAKESLTSKEKVNRSTQPNEAQFFKLNLNQFRSIIQNAPLRETFSGTSPVVIDFPISDGTFESFRVLESPIMHPVLEAKFPMIKTYVAQGITDPTAIMRFSVTQFGLHTMTLSGKRSTTYIDPFTTDQENYIVYNRVSLGGQPQNFECLTEQDVKLPSLERDVNASFKATDDQQLRRFRLAQSCTAEYGNIFGVTPGSETAEIQAQMVITVNRVNSVYEVDLGITLEFIANNDQIIYFGNTNSDPWTNEWNNMTQSTIDAVIGDANYDIGHNFNTTGGGNAGCIGCICNSGDKGSGYTGRANPTGDPFDIDYVAHEMGHQFGGYHVMNTCSRSGSGNTEVEPASGSSIMGYAGICGTNVQANSDAHFNYVNVRDISLNVQSGVSTCATLIGLTNNPPTADAGDDYTIPFGTAFVLEGTSFDADGIGSLTHNWSQNDPEQAPSNAAPQTTWTVGPLYRSIMPTVSPNRYLPNIADVIAGNLTPTWEVTPNVGRNMEFAFMVRDNDAAGGQTADDLMQVTVDGNSGPFEVTSQGTTTTFNAFDNTTVTWNVAGTNVGAVNATNVDIFLSMDGGFTYPITIATATPNDGTENIVIPNNATTNGRIMVRGSGNIFYAINAADFTVVSPSFDYSLSPTPSTITICPPSDAVYTVNTNSFGGYVDPITLSATGVPAGATATFSTNPVIPGNNSTLTISSTGAAATGNFTITIEGNSTSGIKTNDVTLIISDPTPTAVTLTSPADAAIGVLMPTNFTWTASAGAGVMYDIDIATDAGFTSIVDNSVGLASNNYNSNALASGTLFYWRVTAYNACGSAAPSSTFSFETSSVISLPTNGTATTQTLCTGILFDSGGDASNYGADEDAQITISPIGAATVDLNFISFAIEAGQNNNCNYDYLDIFDGPTTGSTLIARYCNDNIPTTVSSTGGSITILFHSDNIIQEAGFEMTWQCNIATVPPTADFTADIDTTCQGVVNFSDASINGPTQWAWDFGDGNSSTQQYPTHTYTSNGVYTVELIATNVNGSDNNIKTDFIVVDMPIAPSTTDDIICANTSANLTAASGSGTLDWFDAATAGNLVYSGTNFTTPTLSANTTYYVETVITTPVINMAKPDNTGGGNNFTANQHLIFDVYNTMEIVSVEVVAQGAGNRTIELRDNTGAVLQSTTVNIPNGIARINLNFTINPGTDYELGLSGASTVDLYRNNTGVSYPYTLPGYGAVTSSSAGLNFYYFFYDWEVKQPNCTSARVPAIATVNNVDVSTSLAGNTITANASPASYQWVDCNNNFSLIGGETNQGYVATVNGDYAAIITENGCVDTTACTNILITGIDGASSNSGISIYPNPATDVLNIDLTTTANIERLTLFDVKGKLIYETVDFTNSNIQINMNKLSEGIYMLKVQSTNEVKNYKVLKQ